MRRLPPLLPLLPPGRVEGSGRFDAQPGDPDQHAGAAGSQGQLSHRDRLLQAVREQADAQDLSQEGVLYMLAAVEVTAQQTINTINTITDIKAALLDTKHRIREGFQVL